MLRRSDRRRLATVLVITDLAFAFQQTAIVPAVQDVQTSLGSSREWSAWLVTVYLIVATVATPALGRLGDLHGRRRMLLVGLVVFLLGCVGAAAAPSMPVLIVCRAVQGVGGAVYPLSLALARDQLPDEQVGGAVALFAGAFGTGTVLGFGVGGVLAEYASWRYVFVAGAVLVALGIWAVHRGLPEAGAPAEGRYDRLGTALLSVAAASLLMGLTLVVSLGWASPVTAGLLALVVVAGGIWARVELRRDDPLVDLRMVGTGAALRANLSALALGWALFGAYLLLPEFARADPGVSGYGFAVGAAGVGALLLPLAVGQAGAAVSAGGLARRIGARRLSVVAMVLVCAAFVLLAASGGPLPAFVVAMGVLGVGAGLALQASSAIASTAVDEDVAAESSSVNSTVRRLGGGVGGQVATILLASLTIGSSVQPSAAAFTISYAVAAGFCLLAGVALCVPHA